MLSYEQAITVHGCGLINSSEPLTDEQKMTNEKNDKGQNAINIFDFLQCPTHLHINSCEEPPMSVWLNNSLSLYCTVSHCATIACSPHISWLISQWVGLYGHSWPSHFDPVVPSHTQYGHCNDEGTFNADCVSSSAAKQESTPYGYDLLSWSRSPSLRNLPLVVLEGNFWRWFGMSGPRVTTTLALSLVPFIHPSSSSVCGVKVLSLWGFTSCVEGLCQDKTFTVIYLLTMIAFMSWIVILYLRLVPFSNQVYNHEWD